MAVDDPTGFNASILGEIKRINARLDQLSGAPLGKLKTRTAANYYSGFSWTGTATAGPRSWITAGAAIVVPPFATKVWIHALATSVVCSNKAAPMLDSPSGPATGHRSRSRGPRGGMSGITSSTGTSTR